MTKNAGSTATIDSLRSLQQLFRRRAQKAVDEAVRSGGEVSPDDLESLGRLGKVIETYRATDPPSNRRYVMGAISAATLLVASVLFFARVRSTEIEVDVRASELSFRLSEAHTLLDGTHLAAIGVSGLSRIEAPGLEFPMGGARIEPAAGGKRL
jgi:hypothetical protein